MKKPLFALIAAAALAACHESDDFMKCGDFEVKTEVQENALAATINGDRVVLPQTISASGVRYEGILNDAKVILWNKGSDWTLYINDGDPIECK